MSKKENAPDYINHHMRTIVTTINRAGDLIAERNHYAAMWTLWRLIPALDEHVRNEFNQYRKFIPEWDTFVDNTKGFNWSQIGFRKKRKMKTFEKKVEKLYWNLYEAMVEAGYFDFDKKYGPKLDKIDFSKAEEI